MALVVTRTRFFLLEINFARGPLSSGYGAGFWRMAVRGKRINAMTDISRAQDKVSAGDPIPPKCAVIEVHIGELKQMFDAIDPSIVPRSGPRSQSRGIHRRLGQGPAP